MGFSNIYVLKTVLWAILAACCILEMIFFPSISNLVGCLVTIVSTWLFFTNVFKIEIVRSRPIAFIAFLQLFFFMFLPLPITLLDGNEMSHDFFIPVETYLLQLFYFCCGILAFYFSGTLLSRNKISEWLKKCGYFVTPTDKQLWILGFIGLFFRLFMMSKQGNGDEELAGAGTLNMFSLLLYSPICILFKPLLGKEKCSRKDATVVYIYIAFLVILLIATNSRSQMLSPLVVFAFCYLLKQIYTYRETLWMSYKKVFIIIISVLVISGPAADMAIAMVIVRGDRSSMNFSELLKKSLEVYQDKEQLTVYRKFIIDKNNSSIGNEWQESYVSSPFLDRLCNYRVADATIYHAQRVGYGNLAMLELYENQILAMFPGPIVKYFFPEIDKSNLNFSTMDKLYLLSANGGLGGVKVGGDVGLGLATFGYFYFPLCCILYFLVFYILDGVVLFFNNGPCFSIFTLISVYFTYFLMFQVAGGIISQTTFVLWKFWWVTIWYCIVFKVIRGGKLNHSLRELLLLYKRVIPCWAYSMKGGVYVR